MAKWGTWLHDEALHFVDEIVVEFQLANKQMTPTRAFNTTKAKLGKPKANIVKEQRSIRQGSEHKQMYHSKIAKKLKGNSSKAESKLADTWLTCDVKRRKVDRHLTKV